MPRAARPPAPLPSKRKINQFEERLGSIESLRRNSLPPPLTAGGSLTSSVSGLRSGIAVDGVAAHKFTSSTMATTVVNGPLYGRRHYRRGSSISSTRKPLPRRQKNTRTGLWTLRESNNWAVFLAQVETSCPRIPAL